MRKYHYDYCPNCDYKVQIEKWPLCSVILEIDSGNPIDTCPNCFIPLIVSKGRLIKDEYRHDNKMHNR